MKLPETAFIVPFRTSENSVCDWDRGVRTGVTRRDAPPQEFSPDTDCMRRASEMKVAESMAMRVVLDE
jgi:hypothetical protein